MKFMQASLESYLLATFTGTKSHVTICEEYTMHLWPKFLAALMSLSYLHASCGGAAVCEEGAIGFLHLCKPERQGKITIFRGGPAQFKERHCEDQFYFETAQMWQSWHAWIGLNDQILWQKHIIQRTFMRNLCYD